MMPQQSPASDVSPRSPRLTPLIAYLLASGWTMVDQDERTSMWQPATNREDLRLILPVQEDVSDYDDLIYEALRLVAYLERRSLNEVANDIVFGPADTVSIRMTPDAPPGQAPLSVAYEAVSALRSYVIGSGAALYDHSLVLPARRARQAEIYASGARFATLFGQLHNVSYLASSGNARWSRT